MRILMLTHEPEGYATYLRCWRLARALVRRGCHVTIVHAGTKDQDRHIVEDESDPDLRRVAVRSFARRGFVDGRYFIDDAYRGLLGCYALRQSAFDVTHAFSMALAAVAVPALFARLALRQRLVIDWCDDFSEGMAGSHHPVVHRLVGLLETGSLLLADHVTVISQYLKDRALRSGVPADRVVRLWNGLDVDDCPSVDKATARKALGLPGGVPIVVSAGTTWTDGMSFLFEATREAARRVRDLRLLLVGRADVPRGAKWAATRRAYEAARSHVWPVGFVLRERMLLYLAAADAVVLPMRDSIADRARVPLRLTDYLACGRPVVANAVGDTKEILSYHPNGFMCEPGDVEGFARLIADAVEAPESLRHAKRVAPGRLPTWDDNALLLLREVYHAQ